MGCPGEPVFEVVGAGPREIYLPANQAIEGDYVRAMGHEAAILFGSQFLAFRDIRLPRGAPNQKFGNLLLEKLRGISQQLQPDIIDFQERAFYEIKTEEYAVANRVKVLYQLSHYYRLTEEIRAEQGPGIEPPWDQMQASWTPAQVIPLPGEAANAFVCTAATDYRSWANGLVLYDVRKRRKKKDREKQRAIKTLAMPEYDRDFAGLLPREKKLRSVLEELDPVYLPEFVIIAPTRVYQKWKGDLADERFRRMYEVKVPPFLDARTVVGRFHRIGWTMVGLTAAAFAGLYAGVILLDAAAFEGPIAGAAGVGIGGGGAATGAEVISLAAYRAMLASKAAASVAAAAGVLIVAGYPRQAQGKEVAIAEVGAIRAMAVEDFKPYKGQMAASSTGDVPGDFVATEESTRGQFGVGTTVLYDWTPHVVIARIVAGY